MSTIIPMIVKSNKLIESSFKLSVPEQRIILTLATRINREDEDFKSYIFSIKELMKITGISGNSQYDEIKNTTLKLMTGVQYREPSGKVTQVPWLSFAQYSAPGEDATVTLQFHPWLKEFLLQLASHFTKYRLENVIQLTSKYSFKIYELLKQYQRIGERTITIEQLRNWLYVEEGEYAKNSDFKRRILDASKKELAIKSDICFDYEEIRPSRKVTAIKFIIKNNTKNTQMEDLDLFSEHYKEIVENLKEPADPTEDFLEKTVLRLKNEFNFKTVTINSLLKKYDPEYINANLDISLAAFKSGKADNLQAYARAAIRDDYRKKPTQHDLDKVETKKIAEQAILEATEAILNQPTTTEIQTPEIAEFAKRMGIIK